jgi:pantoate kinase
MHSAPYNAESEERETVLKEYLTARATAPGHVTGIFVPEVESPDPLSRGSLGAGVVLDRGATARVTLTPSARTTVAMRSRGRKVELPVTAHAVRSLLKEEGRTWAVSVDVVHDLPISGGLGMSAAGTLAASLALARLLGQPPIEGARAAHLAELYSHTGLGGVSAILGGGIEVRRRPGIPPRGVIERTPHDGQVLLAFLDDPMPSMPLLSDPRFLEKVSRAGRDLLGGLSSPPLSIEALMEASSAFSDAMGLAHPLLRGAMDQLRRNGHPVAQAMLGQTLFLPVGADDEKPDDPSSKHPLEITLDRLGFHTVRTRVGTHGAQVLPGPAPRPRYPGKD